MAMASAVIFLSKAQTTPPPQPHLSPQVPPQGADFLAHFQQVLDTRSSLILRVEHLEHDNVAQKLEIVKLKARVKKLEKTNKVKSSKFRRLRKVGAFRRDESSDEMEDVFNQERMINEDEGIELVKDADIAKIEGRHAEKQAEIYNLDLDHPLKVLSMQEDDSEVQEVVTTAKLITDVVTAATSQVSVASATILAAKPRFGKGFSGVETPLFEAHFQQVLDTRSSLILRVEHLEHDNVAQKLEIVKLKARVKKLEKTNKVKSSKFRRLRKVGASRRDESSDEMEDVFNQERMINEDEGIELVKDADIVKIEGRHAEKQAEIYNLDLDHPLTVLSMQEDDSEVQEVVTTAKLITDVVTAATKPSIPAAAPTVVAAYTRRKGVIIRDPKEEVSLKTPAETPGLKDKVQKAAKRRKLIEEAREAKELKKQLEIVNDEDDDVFTEATPLGRKVPVVDYEIVM
nr:hypothetical protein [Tanacetum cinerariifolium]